MRILLLTLFALSPPTTPRNYCDVATCEVCPPEGCPPGGVEVSYCCDLDGGLCDEVKDGTHCGYGKILVICNWGMTNEDGSVTCFDERE